MQKVYFFAFGILDLIALLTALYYSRAVIFDYFSYFTVLSNYLITFVFLSFALYPKTFSKKSWAGKIYGPATLYMIITGIVYWMILRGTNHHLVVIPWINLILHGLMPIVAIIAWIFFPIKSRIKFIEGVKWLIFPLVFVIYTLIRGVFINWYPYTILNPQIQNGYTGVTAYVIGILFGAWVIGIILIEISRIRK